MGVAGRRDRLGVIVALALVAALGLSSCQMLPRLPFDSSAQGTTAPAGGASAAAAQTPPADAPELAPFYAQSLSWTGCSGGECATLRVPVDYAQPGGPTIELALLRVKARSTAERIGSLVVNPGGPGASGVEYATYANQIVGTDVRRRFDVVGFDPRGVGRSAPLNCLDDPALDDFLGQDPTPDDPAEQAAFVRSSQTLADGCQARGGQLLAHVSTEDVARDLDVLRAALGETTLHYLGKSYGTYLGAVYADLFPGKVGRFVLDGVIAPDLTSSQISEGQARGFELATRAYVADCIARGSCPIGSTVEEGMRWFREFLQRLDSTPLPVTGDARVTQLTEAWGSIGISYAMYSKSMWPSLTRALAEAKSGDGNGLMELAGSYAERDSDGSYSGNIMEAIYAVNCLDKPDTADLAVVTANERAFAAVAPTWGRMLAWGSVPCGVWPVQSGKVPTPISAAGSAPIVLVGTTRDPATIYEWAVRLRGQLSNAVLITYDGDGHTAYQRSNSCVDRPIDAYFLNGTVPKDGLQC